MNYLEDAPDEALRWLLTRIRSQQPSGLGLVAHVKNHESTKRTAFYISSPINMYVNLIMSLIIQIIEKKYNLIFFSF